jgi:hypothetical protein
MPKNRAELVEKITKVWDEVITEDLIKKAARGLINRCQKVITAGGKHQNNEWIYLNII